MYVYVCFGNCSRDIWPKPIPLLRSECGERRADFTILVVFVAYSHGCYAHLCIHTTPPIGFRQIDSLQPSLNTAPPSLWTIEADGPRLLAARKLHEQIGRPLSLSLIHSAAIPSPA